MRSFRAPRRKANAEAGLLPMINVVFLLLVFFLIVARLTPPEAFAVTPPKAAGTEIAGDVILMMAADGDLAFGAVRGRDAVLAALARARRDAGASDAAAAPGLTLRADAAAPAAALGALLPDLAAMGFRQINLATVPR